MKRRRFIPRKRIERTLDALLQGYEGDMPAARALLRHLIEISPGSTARSVVPVARRLIDYEGWETRLNAQELVDFIAPRHAAIENLEQFVTADLDPVADYLCGLVAHFAEDIRKHPAPVNKA